MLDQNPRNCPYAYSTINKSFDSRLKDDLDAILSRHRLGGWGTVLELMAGCGRNMELLGRHFSEVEMLERNNSMAAAIGRLSRRPGIIHQQDVRNFDWAERVERFDCIVGIWCLGYLSTQEIKHLLHGVRMALKPDGCIIFFESVLSASESTARLHAVEAQQNMVRASSYYVELFELAGLKVSESQSHNAWED